MEGLVVAGICFIMPVLITGFSLISIKYGQRPVFLYGIKPAIIAIILAAIYPLAKNL
jgi:chromate transporter